MSAMDAERGYTAAVRNAQLDMREVKMAIDSLVKQQAHLEGHFDYARTFEKMRPQLLEGKRVEGPAPATEKAQQPM
ncbi:hypothetical protein ABFV57_32320, partial [Pseudomonas neuropathica]|uniref:hypothetical protein n=1 Tax=Pseudomonas neuropathica TaxID=2730425 RepID=UPI0034D5D7A1